MSALVTSFDTREEWLAYRLGGIGASETAIALGESDWGSPYSLWVEKTGRGVRDANCVEAAKWGLRFEPVIAEAVQEEYGRVVMPNRARTIHQHEYLPWLRATLDAWQWRSQAERDRGDAAGVLQIKTCNQFKASDWKHGPPLEYEIQLQSEMFVAGATWGSLVVLIGGQQLSPLYDRDFDADFMDRNIGRLAEFWRYVETDTPPPLDGSLHTLEAVQRVNPTAARGLSIQLNDQMQEWADQLDAVTESINALTNSKNLLTSQLIAGMADAELGFLPSGGYITCKNVKGRKTRQLKRRTKR